jgi:hypothetical protein
MLQDQDKPDSRVRKELNNSDFQLLISLIQFGTARVEAENKLGEVCRKLYLGTQPEQPEPSHEDAKKREFGGRHRHFQFDIILPIKA